MTVCGFLIAYVFVGCVYWLGMLVGAIRVVRAVPKLADASPPAPAEWPQLSIVIPACNEAAALETALTSLVAQDYPDLELIVVDDRSTDGTAGIVDRMAADEPRIIAIHVEQLPEGWLGKLNALSIGTGKARGEWILYTDADVHFAPGALRRAIAYATDRGLDHMAAIPEMWPASLAVDACIALFCRGFLVAARLWGVSDPHSSAFAGVGAFNLVRRAAFDKTPGFAWLRLEVGDDMGLGMMLKDSGARSSLVNGQALLGLHWYRTLGEMAAGAEKAYASLGHCSFLRMAILSAVLVALEWSPLVALACWRVPGLRWSGLAMLAAAIGSYAILARWSRARVLPGLLFPFAALLAAAITVRSGWLGLRRGGIVWRGTLYPSALLIAERRLRL